MEYKTKSIQLFYSYYVTTYSNQLFKEDYNYKYVYKLYSNVYLFVYELCT